MILEKVILEGSSILKKNGIKTSRLDSELLMSKAINKERVFMILNSNQNLEKNSLNCFFDLIKKRSIGTPVYYLTGKKNFSGIGIDISKKCINLAKINRNKLALRNRIKFLKSDIDNFNYGKYDLIISNPPYIRQLDLKYLERDVINFEPLIALNGGLDGLSEIRKVIYRSFKLLKSNGKLILEIGFNQKNDVKKLLKKKGFYINEVVKDLAKNNRCIISTKIKY